MQFNPGDKVRLNKDVLYDKAVSEDTMIDWGKRYGVFANRIYTVDEHIGDELAIVEDLEPEDGYWDVAMWELIPEIKIDPKYKNFLDKLNEIL